MQNPRRVSGALGTGASQERTGGAAGRGLRGDRARKADGCARPGDAPGPAAKVPFSGASTTLTRALRSLGDSGASGAPTRVGGVPARCASWLKGRCPPRSAEQSGRSTPGAGADGTRGMNLEGSGRGAEFGMSAVSCGNGKLRQWLIDQIDSGKYPGLVWENEEKSIFRIPWKHAGKQDYNREEDAALFKVSGLGSRRGRRGGSGGRPASGAHSAASPGHPRGGPAGSGSPGWHRLSHGRRRGGLGLWGTGAGARPERGEPAGEPLEAGPGEGQSEAPGFWLFVCVFRGPRRPPTLPRIPVCLLHQWVSVSLTASVSVSLSLLFSVSLSLHVFPEVSLSSLSC